MQGQLWFTSDLEQVKQLSLMSKLVYIGEPDPDILNQVPMIIGSILLPPYNALMYEMDGDIQSFYKEYYAHLDTPECVEFIAVIIRALYNGVNITLYTTKDEAAMMYTKALYDYCIYKYGIYIAQPGMVSVTDPNYFGVIFDTFYQYNLCDSDEFFMNIPESYTIYSFITLNKLIVNMAPYIGFPSSDLASYQGFFNNYNRKVKQLGKLPMQLIHGGTLC